MLWYVQVIFDISVVTDSINGIQLIQQGRRLVFLYSLPS